MELLLKRKILLLALTLCIAFPVVFTEMLTVAELDHECITKGENCRPCLYIEAAKSFLKTLKPATDITVYSAADVKPTFQYPQDYTGCNTYPFFPITLKVRLNT